MMANELIDRFSNLSPGQRELVLRKLRQQSLISQETSQVTPITPQPRDEESVFPLSFGQQRLWFLNQFGVDAAAYNLLSAVRLTGQLNIAALEQALNEVVRRHEILRTLFELQDGAPVQIIKPNFDIPLIQVDLKNISTEQQALEIQKLGDEEAHYQFDLATGPLLRAILLQLDSNNFVMFLNMHHIISDGWSTGMLIRELITLYQAFSNNKTSPLPDLPIQYADFSVWQRDWLQSEMLNTHLDYWQQQLSGSPAILELPTDWPRPPVQTYQGVTQSLNLPESLTQSLKKLGKQEGTTLFVTLLAAFNVLLYRYTRQTDILIGSPIANRNRTEIEPLIGFFVNTLVLRTKFSERFTFRELLRQLHKHVLKAYAHQDLPFEKLVEVFQGERDLSRPPIFQVMFALQNMPTASLTTPGLVLEELKLENSGAQFDLSLLMMEVEQHLDGMLIYNTDLFKPQTIARFLNHYQVLLTHIVANPDQVISKLPVLAETEYQQIVTVWNNTTKTYPIEKGYIHQLVETQVEQSPTAIALVFEEQTMTYREFNNQVNRLAHYLRFIGVQLDTQVGICMDRSMDLVIAIHAVIKAGGAYVPIDPTYPRERLNFILTDIQVPVLITQEKYLSLLETTETHLICLDKEQAILTQYSTENPVSQVTDENIAYTLYTSGSTGRPKGVSNTHRAIRNRLLWHQDVHQLTDSDRFLQKTPYSFDVSVWEFFWPLFTGATLVIAKPEGHKDSAYLVDLINTHQITALHFVPSMLQMFLAERQVSTCHSLRYVFCSGEALPLDLQTRFFTLFQTTNLYNLYGPTEAAIDVTYWFCRRHHENRFIPIGHPIANTQIYLLDPYLQPVPIGVSGELYIGGINLARGYFNRPELTAEKFVPNPFNNVVGSRLYKTGDLARYEPDGSIQFLGRIDFQVKVRGVRIELGEIEAALNQHTAIRESVVVTQTTPDGSSRLIAYVVCQKDASPTVSELRRFMESKLPDSMVPSLFLILAEFLLTSSGKVNRRALPPPDQSRPELEKAFVSPRNPVEEVLAGICAELLQIESVGIYDSFFELGGHSLLATQFLSQIREIFQVNISLIQLFQEPTVAGLTETLFEVSNDRLKVEKIATLLLQVMQISDEEAESMLQEPLSIRP